MKVFQILFAATALVACAESALAQEEQTRAAPACWATLPVVDTVRVLFEVHAEEHRIWRGTNLAGLSTDYLTSVAAAIAAHMRVPAQMESRAFSVHLRKRSAPDLAARVASAAATYSPLPAGRVTSIQLYGVGASPAMERALAQAIIAADSAGGIPPLPPGAYPADLTLEISVGSRARAENSEDTLHLAPVHAGASRPVAVGYAHVERYRLDQPVAAMTSTQAVPCPPAARALSADGTVTMEFIVDETGKVDVDRAVLRSADHTDFAHAVAQALPRMRFRPARSGACRLPTVVRQSFVFRIRRP
jgi:TonB family protein